MDKTYHEASRRATRMDRQDKRRWLVCGLACAVVIVLLFNLRPTSSATPQQQCANAGVTASDCDFLWQDIPTYPPVR